MAAIDDKIAVAQVDAPRRRDDVLPEHETQWPATEAVCDVITERYDGTAGTSHEIGLELVTVKYGCYPGWRVEQIAQSLGLSREKRDVLIERVRAEDAAKTSERQRTPQPMKPRIASIDDAIAVVSNGDATPTRRMLREDLQAIASGPKCKECGQPFQPWPSGMGMNRKTCRPCFSAKMSAARQKRDTKSAAPEPEPEPIRVPAPTTPTLAAVLDCSLDGDEDDDVIEDEAELTFADLPGHGAVFELLDLLPTTGRWSGKRRYRWLTAFTATLDLLIDDDRDEEVE